MVHSAVEGIVNAERRITLSVYSGLPPTTVDMVRRDKTYAIPAVGPEAEPIDVYERGKAKYFRGREDIRALLKRRRAWARLESTGTTVLIQGAPGAGKTALLYQLTAEAEREDWTVASLEIQALYDPRLMAQNMGESYITRAQRTVKGDIQVMSTETTKERAGDASVSQVLKTFAPKKGLLLLLDEVQTLIDLSEGPHTHLAKATLNAIHNGQIGCPVILLSGGLGTSENAFYAMGVSRFDKDCLINLGRLSATAEREVICDWLVKDGQAKSDVTPWVDAIAAETHGWPQHIMSYAQPAAASVRRNKGELVKSGLDFALKTGRESANNYYSGRVKGIDVSVRFKLARLLKSHEGQVITAESLFEAMSANSADADAVFNKLLHRGVIVEKHGGYAVPIPSMRDWLIKNFGGGRSRVRRYGLRRDSGLER